MICPECDMFLGQHRNECSLRNIESLIPFEITKEEAKLLLDFMAHQFISYSNNGLIVLVRRMEKFING